MEHVATPAVALAARVQLPGGVKMPVELVVKLTEPVGVIMVPREVSLTVAAQLVPWFTTREEGEQVMLVLVGVLVVIPRLKLLVLPE
jgi:hypothetical protein